MALSKPIMSGSEVPLSRSRVGSPSSRKSHCQPLRPNAPSIVNSAPESGPPTMPAVTTAVMKLATVRARCAAGTHCVR